jgi:hypothetical protein
MSPDIIPIEHVCDFIGRTVNQRNPCQHIAELTNTILEEWQRFQQERLHRLICGMNRRVQKLWHKHGGYTRYWVNVHDNASPYIYLKKIMTRTVFFLIVEKR